MILNINFWASAHTLLHRHLRVSELHTAAPAQLTPYKKKKKRGGGGKFFFFFCPHPAKGVCSLTADTTLPAQLTGIGGAGPQGYLGKTLDFPKPAAPTTVTEESAVIPAVDLVVVIDSSVSMKDEADALNQAVAAAIETAKTKCPSDLRVTYLGIEGTFKNTRFDTTVKSYLTGTAKADESALRGRKKGTVAGGGAQEDGARAIEDVTAALRLAAPAPSAPCSSWATRRSRAAARLH